jgi:hypothetical protein
MSKPKYKTMIVPCKHCDKEFKLQLPMHISVDPGERRVDLRVLPPSANGTANGSAPPGRENYTTFARHGVWKQACETGRAGMKTIDWDLTKLMCDQCLAMYERDSETPLSEYCEACKGRIWRWAQEMFEAREESL